MEDNILSVLQHSDPEYHKEILEDFENNISKYIVKEVHKKWRQKNQ